MKKVWGKGWEKEFFIDWKKIGGKKTQKKIGGRLKNSKKKVGEKLKKVGSKVKKNMKKVLTS